MTTINIPAVSLEAFGAAAELHADCLLLKLSGTGDMSAVPHLERCLRDLHSEVVRLGLRAVTLDIQALYLLNSSCLKALMSFIFTIQKEGPKYEVRFVTDEHLTWQPRSLRVIERLAPDIVSIGTAQ